MTTATYQPILIQTLELGGCHSKLKIVEIRWRTRTLILNKCPSNSDFISCRCLQTTEIRNIKIMEKRGSRLLLLMNRFLSNTEIDCDMLNFPRSTSNMDLS